MTAPRWFLSECFRENGRLVHKGNRHGWMILSRSDMVRSAVVRSAVVRSVMVQSVKGPKCHDPKCRLSEVQLSEVQLSEVQTVRSATGPKCKRSEIQVVWNFKPAHYEIFSCSLGWNGTREGHCSPGYQELAIRLPWKCCAKTSGSGLACFYFHIFFFFGHETSECNMGWTSRLSSLGERPCNQIPCHPLPWVTGRQNVDKLQGRDDCIMNSNIFARGSRMCRFWTKFRDVNGSLGLHCLIAFLDGQLPKFAVKRLPFNLFVSIPFCPCHRFEDSISIGWIKSVPHMY